MTAFNDQSFAQYYARLRYGLAVEAPNFDYGVRTQAEVLERLPQWMRADFDCPSGAHEWLHIVPPTSFNAYAFCKHCPTKRRGPGCPDTERDPLDVIYDLQFSRRS